MHASFGIDQVHNLRLSMLKQICTRQNMLKCKAFDAKLSFDANNNTILHRKGHLESDLLAKFCLWKTWQTETAITLLISHNFRVICQTKTHCTHSARLLRQAKGVFLCIFAVVKENCVRACILKIDHIEHRKIVSEYIN